MSGLPFWLGGPLLAVPTVVYFAVFRRSLGMSGTFERLLHPRRAYEADRLQDELDDEADLVRAMEEATRAEFGDAAVTAEAAPSSPAPSSPAVRTRPPRLTETLAFVGAFVVGAAITARVVPTSRGLGLDGAMVRAAGSEPRAWCALLGGSLLVGLGARLSAGCTSGHGLSGCARRSPTSVAATALFLVAAVVTAFALRRFS